MYLDYSKLEFDAFGCPEEPELVLETMDEQIIGIISGVSELKFNIKYTEVSEMTFDVAKMLDIDTPNPLYDEIVGFRLIYTKHYGVYVIMSPEEEADGVSYVKHITAQSLEKTLDQRKFFLEEGTICLYTIGSTDTLVGRILEIAKGWRTGYISTTLIGKYRTFDSVNEDLMTFMYDTLAEKFRCVFVFDTYEKTINIYDADEERSVLPIYLDFDNLLESINIDELSDEIITAIRPYGADDLSIAEVNPTGTNWIYDLSYFIEIGDIPADLATKWQAWQRAVYANQEYYTGLIGLQVSALSQLRTAENALVDLQGELEDLTIQQSVEIEIQAQEVTDSGKEKRQESIDTLNTAIAAKKEEIATKQAEVDELSELAEGSGSSSYLTRIKAVTEMLDIDKYFTEDEYETLSKFFIEEDITESSFVATDLDEEATAETYNVSTGKFSATGSTIARVTMSQFNKNMYTLAGGTFTVSGSLKLSGDIIRGTLEVRKDDTFVMSLYAGTLKATNTEAPSGMLVFSGDISSLTSDVSKVSDQGVVTYEGTSVSFYMSSADLFLTANISDYKRYSVCLELFEYARKTLHDLATPTYEFTVDSGNFLFNQEFEPFRRHLELGQGVYLRMTDGSIITPLVIEMELDFEDRSEFSLVFSNRFKRKDNVATLKDMLEKSYSSGRSFDASKYLYNQSSSVVSEVRQFITNSLDVARNTILSSKNQSVVINGAGISVTCADDPGVELRIVDGMIAFTNDNWSSPAKLALGHFYATASTGLKDKDGNDIDIGDYWGLNAELVGGNLIIGNNLVLESENSANQVLQFRFDASGAWLNNATFIMQNDSGNKIMLSPEYGIAAGNGYLYTLNGTEVSPTFIDSSGRIIEDDDGFPENVNFYLDIRNGDAYFRGTLQATAGKIGGWTISKSSLYAGSGSSRVELRGDSPASDTYTAYAIWAGANNPANAPFWVKKNGEMSATNGTFTGTLKASKFSGGLSSTDNSWLEGCGIRVGTNSKGYQGYALYVSPTGTAHFAGDIYMSGGSIVWNAIDETGSDAYKKAVAAAQAAANAQSTADDAYDERCTAQNMFNILTGNRKFQGLFSDSNGNLYVNATYIYSDYTETKEVLLANSYGGLKSATGSDSNGNQTVGCMIYGGSSSSPTNYCIATTGGVRMQGGTNSVTVTPSTINLTTKSGGGIYCNGSAITTSDERVKTDISDDMADLEPVFMNLRPVKHRFVDSASGRTHVGFIAQEVESAITDAGLTTTDFAAFVRTKPDDGDAELREYEDQCYLRYDEFVPLNTHMIQLLFKRIEALEAEIASIKSVN